MQRTRGRKFGWGLRALVIYLSLFLILPTFTCTTEDGHCHTTNLLFHGIEELAFELANVEHEHGGHSHETHSESADEEFGGDPFATVDKHSADPVGHQHGHSEFHRVAKGELFRFSEDRRIESERIYAPPTRVRHPFPSEQSHILTSRAHLCTVVLLV